MPAALWIVLLSAVWLLPTVLFLIELARTPLFVPVIATALLAGLAGWFAGWRYWRLRDWEPRLYQVLRVRQFGHFVIRGRHLQRFDPGSRLRRSGLAERVYMTTMGERIHLAALAASLPLLIAALWRRSLPWALYFTLGNVVLNVYPIFLQRWLRGRLARVMPA